MAAKKRGKKKVRGRRPVKKKAGKKKATRKKAGKKKAGKKKATRKKAGKKKATRKKATRKKAAKKKATRKKTKRGSGAKRKPNPAFMKPLTPSQQLGEVIGFASVPRTEVVKKLWRYIKKLGLQDKSNRRLINADAKLQKVFGGKRQVDMFQMTKLVSRHLT